MPIPGERELGGTAPLPLGNPSVRVSPLRTTSQPGELWGHRWKPLGKAITDCFTWVGPGQGASNHNERRIGTRYLYHIGSGGQARTTFLEF